jgi:hypothetical protein
MQRERAADNLRDEPATALRYEPVTERHERGQEPKPGDEREHQHSEDHSFAPLAHPARRRVRELGHAHPAIVDGRRSAVVVPRIDPRHS